MPLVAPLPASPARSLEAVGLAPHDVQIRRTPDGSIDFDWYLLRSREERIASYRRAFRAIGHAIGAAYRAWSKAIRDRRERKRAIAELLGFDDRALQDIGLNRAAIYFAVDHGREDLPPAANTNAQPGRTHRAA